MGLRTSEYTNAIYHKHIHSHRLILLCKPSGKSLRPITCSNLKITVTGRGSPVHTVTVSVTMQHKIHIHRAIVCRQHLYCNAGTFQQLVLTDSLSALVASPPLLYVTNARRFTDWRLVVTAVFFQVSILLHYSASISCLGVLLGLNPTMHSWYCLCLDCHASSVYQGPTFTVY